MGLDVDLYQFNNVDTEAILQLARFLDEPYSEDSFAKWKATRKDERGPWPPEKDLIENRRNLGSKLRELALPDNIWKERGFGGIRISFPSKSNFQCFPVGEWYCFSIARDMMKDLTGKDIYFVFPEVKGDNCWLRPDWAASKQRLRDIHEEIKNLEPAQIVRRSPNLSRIAEHVPDHIRKHCLNPIEVMIETMDYVLSHQHPEQFLFYWSA